MRNHCQRLYRALTQIFKGNQDQPDRFNGLDSLEPRLLMSGDSVVVFNEIQYNPGGTSETLEFVEIHNQHGVDVDISGWKIDGGVEYVFPEGTVIGGGEYFVIAKDPAALAFESGLEEGDLFGPYSGSLSNGGERLRLYSHFNTASTLTVVEPPSIPADELWSVDIQAVGGVISKPTPDTMSGVEFVSGLGDEWNAFNVNGHTGVSVNPSLNLVDSAGDVSSVTFSVTGTVSGWSQAGTILINDYMFVNAGNAASAALWDISGLEAGEEYVMFAYGGVARDANLTVDTDGDGSLLGEVGVLISGGGTELPVITADASGNITGRISAGTAGEANWGGFHLYKKPAEGGGAAFGGGSDVAHLPGDGGNDGRRLMDEVEYDDDGEWPVGADGSGVSLAKINPNTGSESAANWTIADRIGGTPGRMNFVGQGLVETVDTVADSSGNGNDGAATGLVITEDGGGFEGEAGIFNGSTTYVEVPVSLDPADTPQITFGAWVKSDTDSTQHAIISNDDGAWDRSITIGSNPVSDFVNPPADVWNAFTIPSYSTLTANPSMSNLVDSEGNTTSVSVNVTGTVSSFTNNGGGTDLSRDYLFVNAGGADANATFEITGLTPGQTYSFYAYGGVGRDIGITMDVDGDGALTGDLQVFASNVGQLFEVTANASGEILGRMASGSVAEGNFAGFQLWDVNGAGTLWSVDIQGDGVGGLFGQVPPITQSGEVPPPSAVGAGWSAFAGGHQFDGTNVPVDTEAWTFISGVFDETTSSMTLYLDPDASTTDDGLLSYVDNATAFNGSALPTNIGRLPSGQWYFDGLIDNVFFFDGVLDATQMTAIRDGGVSGITGITGHELLALHEFEDGDDGSGPDPNVPIIVPPLQINELSSTNDVEYQVELFNAGDDAIDLAGMVLGSSDDLVSPYVLPETVLAVGEYLVLSSSEFGFMPADGDRLFLYNADVTALVDAAEADDTARGLDGNGRWLNTTSATFGSENVFALSDAIVINEIMYHAYPDRGEPAIPPTYDVTTLLPFDAEWRYNENLSNAGLPSGWDDVVHSVDNVDWFEGTGPIGFETDALPIALNTSLNDPQGNTPYVTTYYFETEFTFDGVSGDFDLLLNAMIDDGAIFYLNGDEVYRVNMGAGAVTPATFASAGVGQASPSGPVVIPSVELFAGVNRLSVEVHQVNEGSSDFVMGAELSIREQTSEGTPGTGYSENPEEWIELYNKSAQPVDLTGWELDGAIDYKFADGQMIGPGEYLVIAKDGMSLAEKHPGVAGQILGDFSGTLSNSNELIVLNDANGNPADEVHYYDGGRWDALADGGGSSLELRDADSDNSSPEAWAGSDESSRSEWGTYTYRGVAQNDGLGNNIFHEFVLGLLNSGVVLLDDISVIEDPDGAATEFISNGGFESDTVGLKPSDWLLIGTHGDHGMSVVVTDPEDVGNQVLRLVATGATEDKHNQVSTTYANGEQLQVGQEYEISFRAKWVSGSNQVNTRMYFNYLQRTTLVDVPEALIGGTPGAVNSQAEVNAGPTYTNFTHGPVVPQPGEAVTVSVHADDVDGVSGVNLYYAVEGGGFVSVGMTDDGNGNYTGQIPGLSAGQVVQFYVEGTDGLGAVSTFPREGASSRAMYEVDDGRASLGEVHNIRVIMDPADINFMYTNVNRMSNHRLGATVIYDESQVFYDVAVRLKGSAFGRTHDSETGINIQFHPDQLFRGVYDTVTIERNNNKKEIISKQMLNRASGGLTSFYDDVGRILMPRTQDTGNFIIAMSRTTDVYLESTYGEDANDYPLINFELLYSPTGTSAGVGSQKLNFPYTHASGHPDIEDLGPDKESYRWNFQMRNARDIDNYEPIIQLGQTFSLTGQALEDAVDDIIDVDQWMRTWAMMSINGNDDFYSRVFSHNFRFYQRPDDGKFVAIPWDFDRSFQISVTAHPWAQTDAFGDAANVAKIIERPIYNRLFWGHVLDISNTTANTDYMADWVAHYGSLLGQNFGGELNYITNRVQYLLSQMPGQISFEITSNGGVDFSTGDASVELNGQGWVNVREIRLAATGEVLELTWLDEDNWAISLPLLNGANEIELLAIDHQGNEVGSDIITITSTATTPVYDSLRVTEIHYNPSNVTESEALGGVTDSEQFEFIELQNTSATETLDLTGVMFTNGISFDFSGSVTSLAPGEIVLVVSDATAFELRYGSAADDGTPYVIAGEYDGQLSNGGEGIELVDSVGLVVESFDFEDGSDEVDEADWHPLTDGGGASLSVLDAHGDKSIGTNWRASGIDGGTPGRLDPNEGALPGDANYDGLVNLEDLAKLATNFGNSSLADPLLDVRWLHGDFTGDGVVDLADLARLATFFGQSQMFGGGGAGSVEDSANLLDEASGETMDVGVRSEALFVKTDAVLSSSNVAKWDHIGSLLSDDDEFDQLL